MNLNNVMSNFLSIIRNLVVKRKGDEMRWTALLYGLLKTFVFLSVRSIVDISCT